MDFCSALIAEEREEVCLAVCLNAKSAVTYSEIVGRGNSSETPFSLRRIVEIALAQKSNAIIIAHNHPSGDPKPSALDIENTRRLRLLLNEVGIDMQEHIIVCSSACYAIVRGYSRSTEHFGSTSDTAQKPARKRSMCASLYQTAVRDAASLNNVGLTVIIIAQYFGLSKERT